MFVRNRFMGDMTPEVNKSPDLCIPDNGPSLKEIYARAQAGLVVISSISDSQFSDIPVHRSCDSFEIEELALKELKSLQLSKVESETQSEASNTKENHEEAESSEGD